MSMMKQTAWMIGAALMAQAACAAQNPNVSRDRVLAAADTRDPNLAAVQATGSSQPAAPQMDDIRRFLCGRARTQLELLESEMTRVALRLQHEGTDAQRAEWGPVLGDIEHDRRILAAGLIEAERAPVEAWPEEHALLPSMIDVLTFVGTQTITEIEQALDAPAEPPPEGPGAPQGV